MSPSVRRVVRRLLRRAAPLAAVAALAAPAAAQVQFMLPQSRAALGFLGNTSLPIRSVAMADLDGDGRVDVRGLSTSIFGSSLVGPAGTVALTVSGDQITFFDVDNDGDADLLVGPRDGTHPTPLTLLANDGAGAFASPVVPFGTQQVQGWAWGDVDGDGDRDLVAGVVPSAGSTTGIQLVRNQGAMTFAADPAAVPVGLPYGCHPQLLDVDNDGDLDVLASSLGSGHVLLTNDGSGNFSDARAQLPPMRIGHVWTAAGDIDGDGFADAASIWFTGEVDVLWGTGAGTFVFQASVAPAGTTSRIELGDMDADGDLELFTYQTDRIELFENLGARSFAAPRILAGPAAGTVGRSGSLNRDAAVDLIAVPGGMGSGVAFFGTPGGFVTDSAHDAGFAPVAGAGDRIHVSAAGDVDNDGRPDVLIMTTTGLVVQRGLGADRWAGTLQTQVASTTATLDRLHLLDLDRDGDLDLLISSAGRLAAYTNDGSGVFAPGHRFPDHVSVNTPGDDPQFGDVDGDGDPDVVRATSTGPVLSRNLGGGAFAPEVQLMAAANRQVATLIDIDGDGDLDVATDIVAAVGGHVLLANDGTGTFAQSATARANLGATPVRAVAGDVDGDGDADLIARDNGFVTFRLLLNDGNGRFTVSTGMPNQQRTGSATALLEDFDGDGDLDVFGLAGGALLLLNDGAGRFLDATQSRIHQSLSSLTLVDASAGDIDGDGDLDVMLGGSGTGSWRLVINHSRQLLSRTAPNLGTEITLDALTGPGYGPSGFVLVLADFGQPPAPLHFPGVSGGFELAAATASLGLSLATSVGISRTILPVPANPTLQGIGLHFQALLLPAGGVPGFTNPVFERVLP